jgi:hypothetical protein
MVTVGVTCNFCGDTYKGNVDMLPVTEFEISPGYGSNKDCDRYHLDICDVCLDELLAKLKVKV